jgi:hypothetical protein
MIAGLYFQNQKKKVKNKFPNKLEIIKIKKTLEKLDMQKWSLLKCGF